MKKVTLFFCDICGTLDSNGLLKINDNEIERFADNLNQLILYNKTDNLIFTFVTTENLDTVLFMEKQLKLYINSNICFGNHIYDDGMNRVNKPYYILSYILKLESMYNIDNNIYYADDSAFFHSILQELKDYYNIKYFVNSIIPKNNGLHDVNTMIEDLLNNFYKKKILKINPK